MGLTKLALKIAAPAPKIETFSKYLFIGPHPDDIEIGCGATAAKLAKQGKQITFLILTDGRYGDGLAGGIKGAELAALRKKESIASAERLGVKDVRFLDLCDGGFYDYEDMKKGIARIAGECRPDLIFAPDPYTGRECHIDHLNTGHAAAHVAYFCPYPGIMNRLGADAAEGSPEAKQLQMYLKLRSADFGFRRMCAHAEGFRVLGQTHMHCIPEKV